MPIVDCVCERNIFLIPAVVSCLIPTDEQQSRAARIEGIKNAIRPSFVLDAQLAHMCMTRRLDAGRMRHPECRTEFLQKADRKIHALLFGGGKAIPPLAEFVGEFDFPRQGSLCHRRHNVVNDIFGRLRRRSACSRWGIAPSAVLPAGDPARFQLAFTMRSL